MPNEDHPGIRSAEVLANVSICREHFRLMLRVGGFPDAKPGQFVHLCPAESEAPDYRVYEVDSDEAVWCGGSVEWQQHLKEPMLRRAFSIAGLDRESPMANHEASGSRIAIHDSRFTTHEARTTIHVIYRVVGSATRWLAGLGAGDRVSVLGPLGNAFPISATKRHAWMVAGGVGLPPMLWLAEALRAAGRRAVALCGARSRDLMPLTLCADVNPSSDARTAVHCTMEFNGSDTRVVLATDDGSLGFKGHVGSALAAYYGAAGVAPADLVLYTCGPEIMMRGVAAFAAERGIECYACVERAMACGLGTCQSCVVPIREPRDAAGWRYALCCTAGPVFPADQVLWEVARP